MKKFENFKAALVNLNDIFSYKEPYGNVEIAGMVGLYEICFEQSWKAMKELLENFGYAEGATGSPRTILKTAYKAGMISDEELWLDALVSRNNVAHAYNQAIAMDIIRQTKEKYYDMFIQLEKKIDFLSSHSSDSSSPSKGRFRDKYSTRILDALPDMLTVFDHDANIIELASSPATNHVEGISPNNITTTNVKDILPKEAYESVRKNMDKVILTGESSTARHELMLDGVLHHYENRIFPLDKKYLLCMCRDISQQWEAEQTNAQQQKELKAARIKAEESDRLKSAFLANMSHEIRTPLNAIVGFSKLITYATSAEEKNQYSEIIERNSEMLLNLFNDILDLASLEADSLKFNIRPIKLIDICLQLEQQFWHKTQNGVKLILDDVDTDMYTSGDWNRIIQIISNLLSNATKFTPKGEIHFGYREKEDFVEFYVKDSGIGIPAARIATIFRRFGKVNDFVQGTGLGLTLCRMLVEKMGGRIWLRSQEGQGSRFYFTLPLIRQ